MPHYLSLLLHLTLQFFKAYIAPIPTPAHFLQTTTFHTIFLIRFLPAHPAQGYVTAFVVSYFALSGRLK